MSDNFKEAFPVYIIGDSHVLPYKNMVFRERLTGSWIVTKTHYIGGFKASDLWQGGDQGIHSEFFRALEYEGLIRNGRASHLSREITDFNIAQAGGRPVVVPLLMLTCGDIDVRDILLRELKDEYDIIPPFETPYQKTGSQIYPWDLFEKALNHLLDPLVAGLAHLRGAGFSRIYIQSIVPPTTGDKKFEEMLGFPCPLNVRYKAVAAFNKVMAERCEQLNVHVIDIWPSLTQNGLLKSEFEVDGVHVPPKAAALHLIETLEHSINRSWFGTNYVRYELFYKLAQSRNK